MVEGNSFYKTAKGRQDTPTYQYVIIEHRQGNNVTKIVVSLQCYQTLSMDHIIKPCTEKQLPEILAIFNDAILNSTALYDYKPRTMDNMATWYEAKQKGNYPVTGVFDKADKLLGFGSYGPFRGFPAYKYTVEHSIYVSAAMRGMGFGKILLKEIINTATEQNYHVLVGGIDSTNTVSIKLHESQGFVYSGTIKHAGYKFGGWLDLAFYQLILNTPANPIDG